MKMLRLKSDSDPNEMVEYLMHRHALYLTGSKINNAQLKELV
jgi:hypothetical protein